MNYWQFKFNMKKGNWDEFETIESGEKFIQSTTRIMLSNCIGDIVFYYRTDSNKGIYFIAEIISEPYMHEYNTGYAVNLRIIKRLDIYYDNKSNKIYHDLQNKLDKKYQGGEKYLLRDADKGEQLYSLLMGQNTKVNIKQNELNKDDLISVQNIKQKYIDNGYLFNTFHNLNLIRGEVKHLAFIGNLLNPYGNHFKNDLFLNNFIQSLLNYIDLNSNKELQTFTEKNPFVKIEKIINDTNNNKQIGRIDLWLENDDFIIAIEGKIEAKDNKGQLQKYDEYLQKQEKEYLLVYLTLNKNEKPEKVDINLLKNFHLMNFEEDILEFINESIEDENITGNIQDTLLDYKDALIKYMYKYHLSFQYSYELIQEMTRDKETFIKYQEIKEYYYRNKQKSRNTVIEDVAENFEYAKAFIERNLFTNLTEKLNKINNYKICDTLNSNITLNENDQSISNDIYRIDYSRKLRLLYDAKIIYSIVCDNDFNIVIENGFYGLEINSKIILDKSAFKGEKLIKLLDEKYMNKQVEKIIASIYEER